MLRPSSRRTVGLSGSLWDMAANRAAASAWAPDRYRSSAARSRSAGAGSGAKMTGVGGRGARGADWAAEGDAPSDTAAVALRRGGRRAMPRAYTRDFTIDMRAWVYAVMTVVMAREAGLDHGHGTTGSPKRAGIRASARPAGRYQRARTPRRQPRRARNASGTAHSSNDEGSGNGRSDHETVGVRAGPPGPGVDWCNPTCRRPPAEGRRAGQRTPRNIRVRQQQEFAGALHADRVAVAGGCRADTPSSPRLAVLLPAPGRSRHPVSRLPRARIPARRGPPMKKSLSSANPSCRSNPRRWRPHRVRPRHR